MVQIGRGGRSLAPDTAILLLVTLVTAAGNTALFSVIPAIGRALHLPDLALGITFSFSALIWALASPRWARRSDQQGRRRMVLIGITGFTGSMVLCTLTLMAGLRGWAPPAVALVGFIIARGIYGFFGAAAPPAAQAMIVLRTSRANRTSALALLASAFGLGTILGPAFAPFWVLPGFGLAGPAFVFVLIGAGTLYLAARFLPPDVGGGVRGVSTAEPSIGADASNTALIEELNTQSSVDLKSTDPRIWPWMMIGLIAGHAQAMTGQTLAFLIIDRLQLPPATAQPFIGLILMAGAGAALLAQWGIIPRLNLKPRELALWGSAIGGVGCLAIVFAKDVHGLAVAYALASLGFGLVRPGFTAGASLAVGSREQNAVAGRIAAVNGFAFVLAPAVGIALYEVARPLPYAISAAIMLVATVYAFKRLPSSRAA